MIGGQESEKKEGGVGQGPKARFLCERNLE